MKHILTLLSAIALTLLSCSTYAQKTDKTTDDYNLQKAYQALREDRDEAKALDLVNKQLRETPDNVEALLFRVRLLRFREDFGQALTDINHAIRVNKPKKSEISNALLYYWKGYVYDDLEETVQASEAFKKAYELAQKEDKKIVPDVAFDYAQSLFTLGDIAGSDAVYYKMLQDDETNQGARVGVARNMIRRGEYKQAVELLEKCTRMAPNYASPYRYLTQAYDKLGETGKAIDAALDWYDKEDDPELPMIKSVLKKRPNYSEAAIKSRIKNSDNPSQWKFVLCRFYTCVYRFADAIRSFDEMEAEFGSYAGINYYRSQCYSELGLNEQAIADISIIMENNDDWDLFCERGDYYRLSGKLDRAIEDFSSAIDEDPRLSYAYYKRGWCYEMKGDRKKALEDYNLGIELEDDYPYLYLMRGELLLLEGKKAEAEADFNAVLRLDTEADGNSCRQYALHFLGRNDEAEEWMNRIIAGDPEDNGNYYDQACLYSRMGRLQESVEAMRTAFEKGYRDFNHLVLDDDMDAVRDLPEFKALVQEYWQKHETYLKEFDFTAPHPRGRYVKTGWIKPC